jgi:type I restriction enzyme, S subunit
MYKRYERYKDSGIEWIGEIPEHWDINKLKRLAKIVTGNTPPKRDDKNYSVEGIQWIKPDNILDNGKVAISKKRLSEVGLSKARLIPAGSALVCCIGTIGRVGVNDKDVTTNQQINSVIFNRNDLWHNGYGYYSLLVSQKEHNKYSNKVVVPILNKDNQGNIYFPVPNKYEQKEISDFLNRKISEIDSLIADKEKLIERLEEYKQSIITEAATKGLNPDVKMKDSGIEWIGEIPEHWEIIRLRFLCKIETGTRDTQDSIPDGQYPFFVRADTVERLNDFTHDCEAVMTAGDGVGVGRVFHYYKGKFSGHQRLYIFRSFKRCIGKFIFHYLKVNLANEVLKSNAKSTVDSLRRPMLTSFPVCIPPLLEQEKIIVNLGHRIHDLENLIEFVQSSIFNLKQYRQSLIYEAVTGKIDVRDYQPERSEQLA